MDATVLDKHTYWRALVAFIDILGFSNYVETATDVEIESMHECLCKIRSFESDKRLQFLHIGLPECLTFSFSDMFVRITPLCDSDGQELDDNTIDEIIHAELTAIAGIQNRILQEFGILLRGGLTDGPIFADHSNNILFGPAMNRAYHLEQDKDMAVNPRVVVDFDCSKKNHYITNMLYTDNETKSEMKTSIDWLGVEKDESLIDNSIAINLGFVHSSEIFDFLSRIRIVFIALIFRYSKTDGHVYYKYKWLQDMYNATIQHAMEIYPGEISSKLRNLQIKGMSSKGLKLFEEKFSDACEFFEDGIMDSAINDLLECETILKGESCDEGVLAWWIYNKLSHCYDRKGVFADNQNDRNDAYNMALSYSIMAFSQMEKEYKFDLDSEPWCIALNDLGNTYNNVGKYDEALEYLEKALAIAEKGNFDSSDALGPIYGNIGSAYRGKGDFNNTTKYDLLALKYDQEKYGLNHRRTALRLHNIAVYYFDNGMSDDAITFIKAAYNSYVGSLGENHPDTVRCADFMHNLIEISGNDNVTVSISVQKAKEFLNDVGLFGESIDELHKGKLKEGISGLKTVINQISIDGENNGDNTDTQEIALAFVYRALADACSNSHYNVGDAVIYRILYLNIIEKHPGEMDEIGSQHPFPARDSGLDDLHIRWYYRE